MPDTKIYKGRKLRRTHHDYAGHKVGEVFTVESVAGDTIYFEGSSTSYSSKYYELVEIHAYPCIVVTPPQPAKKEIVSGRLVGPFTIHPTPNGYGVYLYKNGEVCCHLTKELAATLGPALIELAKVMKDA